VIKINIQTIIQAKNFPSISLISGVILITAGNALGIALIAIGVISQFAWLATKVRW